MYFLLSIPSLRTYEKEPKEVNGKDFYLFFKEESNEEEGNEEIRRELCLA